MIFLIAGNLNQAVAAFEFMEPLLTGRDYTFVQYRALGWSAKDTARAITQKASGQKITVFTISVGDHVARHLETMTWNGLEIYAINPCPDRKSLRPSLRLALTVVAPILEVFCHLIGWLSIIPIIPTPDAPYSLMLLADQYFALAFERTPKAIGHTEAVLISLNDELLDNCYLQWKFKKTRKIAIETRHGDTIGAAALYLEGMEIALNPPKS